MENILYENRNADSYLAINFILIHKLNVKTKPQRVVLLCGVNMALPKARKSPEHCRSCCKNRRENVIDLWFSENIKYLLPEYLNYF